MAIALRAAPTRSAYTTSTSVDFTKPTGLAVGDLIVVDFYLGTTKTLTAPDAGWHQVGSAIAFTGVAAGYQAYKYWKIADGTEAATISFTFTTATDHTGAIVAYSGVDQVTPFDVTTVSASGSSASIDAPSITTVTANALLLWSALHWNGTSGSETPTSGFTIQLNEATRDNIIQDATQAVAGASGTKSVSTGSTPWVVWMDALRPSSATNATVAPPGGSARDAAAAPAVSAGSMTAAPAGRDVGAARPPTVTASSSAASVSSARRGAAPAATVTSSSTITAPAAGQLGGAAPAAVTTGVNVTVVAPSAGSTGASAAFAVMATATIALAPARAAGAAAPGQPTATVSITPPAAGAQRASSAPTVTSGSTVTVAPAGARGSASAPSVSNTTSAIVIAPAAGALRGVSTAVVVAGGVGLDWSKLAGTVGTSQRVGTVGFSQRAGTLGISTRAGTLGSSKVAGTVGATRMGGSL